MSFKQAIKNTLHKLPYIKGLYEGSRNTIHPNGHYYSPVISIEDVIARQDAIWKDVLIDGIPEVDLHTASQLELMNKLASFYDDLPFEKVKTPGLRYFYINKYFSYADGIVLYALIRHLKPRRIIEIGSGFTSAIMMDVNELFFGNQIELTFIEPYPDRLFSLMKEGDRDKHTVLAEDAQSIPLEYFTRLEAGDILFVDSTHVTKTGSDVNYILFKVLPVLNKGVWVHFHDIYYPFEYPKSNVFRGFNWNEAYILRAFLMYNPSFRIVLFSDYLKALHPQAFQDMPLCYECDGGSLWIEKI